jgi:hypothetical protein
VSCERQKLAARSSWPTAAQKAPIEIGAAHEIKVPLLAMRCKSAEGILTEYEGIAIKMLPKRWFWRKSLQKIAKRQYYLIVN